MKERISALMDGEASASEVGHALSGLKTDADLRRIWDTYHLIGDSIRGHVAPALAEKVSRQLAAEPSILAPQRRVPRTRVARLAFRAAAAVAGIALVAWLALPGLDPEPQQIAGSTPPATSVMAVTTPVAVGVENYLFAHQNYSPVGAIQGVASYLRTVADEHGVQSK